MPWIRNSVIQMTVLGRSAGGQQILNVFHYRDTQPGTDGPTDVGIAVDTFSDGFISAWRTNVLPLLSADYSVTTYRTTVFDSVVANPTPPPPTQLNVFIQNDEPGGGLDVGAKPGDTMPSFNAIGTQKLSDRAGRNFKGSFRVGTIIEADSSGNLLTAPALAAAQPAMEAFVTTQITYELTFIAQMAVFSRTLALASPVGNQDLRAFTAGVTGARVNAFVTSQVSRKASLSAPS